MRQEIEMSSIKIAPSILAADFARLGEDVREVLDAGAEYIHVDVMDGYFVPNISIGIPVVYSLRKAFPDAFLDVHLMIREPGRYVAAFADVGSSLLTIHVEADYPEYIDVALKEIRNHGMKACLALRPKTPASAVEPWIDGLDMVLPMTVQPGFGGQSFMMDQLAKIRELRAMIEERGLDCDVEIDGGVTPDTAPLAIDAGANVLVAGSAVFGKTDRREAIDRLRCK